MAKTPTPYKAYVPIDGDRWVVESACGHLVADCGLAANPNSRDHALFIKAACNSHEALVTALEQLLDEYAKALAEFGCGEVWNASTLKYREVLFHAKAED